MDARSPRDGRAIEELGHYDPMVRNVDARTVLDVNRIRYWLSVGAQPTEPVLAILKLTGDWQKYKGLEAPAPLLVAEAKADHRALFEAAASAAGDGPKGEAITPKAKKSEKPAEAEASAESTEA